MGASHKLILRKNRLFLRKSEFNAILCASVCDNKRMFRKLLSFIILLMLVGGLFAEETAKSDTSSQAKMALGLGPEWNMDSRDNFAGGAALCFDYNLPIALAPFAAGLNVSVSSNFSGTAVLEPAALFRWYFLGKGFSGFFAQADLGAFFLFEDGETYPYFLGGLRAGYRFSLGKMFFVEPYGRLGYPFAFGFGAVAGMQVASSNEQRAKE
jgi:hypothetical protein